MEPITTKNNLDWPSLSIVFYYKEYRCFFIIIFGFVTIFVVTLSFLLCQSNYLCSQQGAEFPQAVVGFDPDMDPQYHQSCGVLITDDNWLSVIRIPVVAKLDGASDGQQIREAYVWSSVHYASLEITSSLVSTVTVTATFRWVSARKT